MGKSRKILHMDMDYFFAQIEERENPQFKGNPLVVGADPKKGKGRGVVSTCNYEARKYGIKSGMPISRSYKLAPEAIFLPVNMSLYKKVSDSVFRVASKISPEMEKVSLDEAYIDITKKVKNYREAEGVGKKLKREILKKEKLTCSIGVSKNKMMAKIACELAKPDGIKVVPPGQVTGVIDGMDLETVPGIGPKTKKLLKEVLKKENPKIKDALSLSKEELMDLLGKRGGEFYHKFRGIDDSSVVEKRKAKSIGKEHTFQKDTRDSKEIIKVFKSLVGDVYRQAKDKRVKGITVVCRYEDFETHTKQISFETKMRSKELFYKKSVPLLLKFLMQSNKKLRLIGFRVMIK